MADHHNPEIDFIPVAAQDIMPERQSMWAFFTRATTVGIVVVIGLLLFLKACVG
jgi:hypothetical protein